VAREYPTAGAGVAAKVVAAAGAAAVVAPYD